MKKGTSPRSAVKGAAEQDDSAMDLVRIVVWFPTWLFRREHRQMVVRMATRIVTRSKP